MTICHDDDQNENPLDPSGPKLAMAARVIFALAGLLMVLSGVVGNLMVLSNLCTSKMLRVSCVHNTILINMSLADLVCTGYWLPFFVLDMTLGCSPFFNQQHCVVNSLIIVTAEAVSVVSLLAITVNRYLHVCHSRLHHVLVTRRRAMLLCCLAWPLCLLLALPPLLGYGRYGYHPVHHLCFFSVAHRLDYPKPYVLALFGALLLCQTYCNLAIYRLWSRSQQAVKRHSTSRRRHSTADGPGLGGGQGPGGRARRLSSVKPPAAPVVAEEGETEDTGCDWAGREAENTSGLELESSVVSGLEMNNPVLSRLASELVSTPPGDSTSLASHPDNGPTNRQTSHWSRQLRSLSVRTDSGLRQRPRCTVGLIPSGRDKALVKATSSHQQGTEKEWWKSYIDLSPYSHTTPSLDNIRSASKGALAAHEQTYPWYESFTEFTLPNIAFAAQPTESSELASQHSDVDTLGSLESSSQAALSHTVLAEQHELKSLQSDVDSCVSPESESSRVSSPPQELAVEQTAEQEAERWSQKDIREPLASVSPTFRTYWNRWQDAAGQRRKEAPGSSLARSAETRDDSPQRASEPVALERLRKQSHNVDPSSLTLNASDYVDASSYKPSDGVEVSHKVDASTDKGCGSSEYGQQKKGRSVQAARAAGCPDRSPGWASWWLCPGRRVSLGVTTFTLTSTTSPRDSGAPPRADRTVKTLRTAQERGLIRALLAVVTITVLSMTPFFVLTALEMWALAPQEVEIASGLLLFTNNACNWLVYALLVPSMRKRYRNHVTRIANHPTCCCLHCSRS